MTDWNENFNPDIDDQSDSRCTGWAIIDGFIIGFSKLKKWNRNRKIKKLNNQKLTSH